MARSRTTGAIFLPSVPGLLSVTREMANIIFISFPKSSPISTGTIPRCSRRSRTSSIFGLREVFAASVVTLSTLSIKTHLPTESYARYSRVRSIIFRPRDATKFCASCARAVLSLTARGRSERLFSLTYRRRETSATRAAASLIWYSPLSTWNAIR